MNQNLDLLHFTRCIKRTKKSKTKNPDSFDLKKKHFLPMETGDSQGHSGSITVVTKYGWR